MFQRGMSVVCRTARGLEFGSVLNQMRASVADMPQAGQIVRGATTEDHLMWARLQKHRVAALDGCQQILAERGIAATLMDCEVLFDGQSIFFYFLGDITPELESLTSELANTYEAKAQLKQFADAMTLGCGPDCGTEEGGGCSDGGCSGCSIAAACKTTSHNGAS